MSKLEQEEFFFRASGLDFSFVSKRLKIPLRVRSPEILFLFHVHRELDDANLALTLTNALRALAGFLEEVKYLERDFFFSDFSFLDDFFCLTTVFLFVTCNGLRRDVGFQTNFLDFCLGASIDRYFDPRLSIVEWSPFNPCMGFRTREAKYFGRIFGIDRSRRAFVVSLSLFRFTDESISTALLNLK